MGGVLTRMARRATVQGIPLMLTLEDVSDPAPAKVMEKTRGGSVIEREVNPGIEAMSASLTITGATSEVLAVYGLTTGRTAAVTVEEAYRDEDGNKYTVVSEWIGEASKIEDSNTKMGELAQTVISFSPSWKKKTINGVIVWEVATNGSVMNLGTEDILAEFRSMVGLY